MTKIEITVLKDADAYWWHAQESSNEEGVHISGGVVDGIIPKKQEGWEEWL